MRSRVLVRASGSGHGGATPEALNALGCSGPLDLLTAAWTSLLMWIRTGAAEPGASPPEAAAAHWAQARAELDAAFDALLRGA